MAGIDEVLERLLTDAQFARHLAQDPASTLAGYELTADDLTLLSTQVSFDPGALSLVEERISKSSMFGLLTTITGGLGGGETQLPGLPMSPGVVAPVDLEEVIGPTDSEGVVSPVDMQVPAVQSPDGGSIGDGGGSEVFIREAAVAPEPVPDGGGGGGAGGEVSIKEVDPAPQPSAEADGVVVQGGVPAPDAVIIQGGMPAPDGIIIQGGMPAPDGIIVQGGMPAPDGVVVQGGMTPPDGTIGLSEADGVGVADGVVVQGGLTGPGESEAVTYPI